jgi:hypothetical protein
MLVFAAELGSVFSSSSNSRRLWGWSGEFNTWEGAVAKDSLWSDREDGTIVSSNSRFGPEVFPAGVIDCCDICEELPMLATVVGTVGKEDTDMSERVLRAGVFFEVGEREWEALLLTVECDRSGETGISNEPDWSGTEASIPIVRESLLLHETLWTWAESDPDPEWPNDGIWGMSVIFVSKGLIGVIPAELAGLKSGDDGLLCLEFDIGVWGASVVDIDAATSPDESTDRELLILRSMLSICLFPHTKLNSFKVYFFQALKYQVFGVNDQVALEHACVIKVSCGWTAVYSYRNSSVFAL